MGAPTLGPQIPTVPKTAADLTDDALKKSALAEKSFLATRKGRKSTFLTGPDGDTTAAPITRKTLLGG